MHSRAIVQTTRLFLLAGFLAPVTFGQHPYLVQDINQAAGETLSSYPRDFVTAGGVTFFSAERPDVGRELWKCVGWAAPELVADLHAGASSSPEELTALGGLVVFSVETAATGRELGVSDGTEAGTFLIELRPGSESSDPAGFTLVGGELFFAARVNGIGRELWKTDGTPAGTVLVADVSPTVGSSPKDLVESGGLLYFTANDPALGRELWSSDGSPGGTQLVVDLVPGAGSSQPQELSAAGGDLYFSAVGPDGREPYHLDGGTGVVQSLGDLEPGAGGSSPTEFTGVGGAVFFTAFSAATGRELWTTDGTAAGTLLAWDIVPGVESSNLRSLTEFDDQLAFIARLSAVTFLEVLLGDGTQSGTQALAPYGVGSTVPIELAELNGQLIFEYANGVGKWNGTSVKQLTSFHNNDYALYADGTHLWFGGQHFTGSELFISDGTTAGTVVLADISVGKKNEGSDPHSFTAFRGELVFRTEPEEAGEYELWKSDGTAAGTGPLFANAPWSVLLGVRAAGGQLFVTAHHPDHGAHPSRLWVSDGTEAGTKVIDTEPPLSSIGAMFEYDGEVYFAGRGGSLGLELWTTDGTTAELFIDLDPGLPSSSPGDFFVFDDLLYFKASGPASSGGLMQTDGTVAGTVDAAPGLSEVFGTIEFGGQLIVNGSTASVENELFSLDAAGNSSLILDIAPGALESYPTAFAHTDNGVVFRAAGSTGSGTGVAAEWELWRTDGTTAGTYRLLEAGDGDGVEGPIEAAGGLAYFQVDTASGDNEVWQTDGTVAGTVPLLGLGPLAVGDANVSSLGGGMRGALAVGDGTEALIVLDQGWGAALWRIDEGELSLLADMSSSYPDTYAPSNFLRAGKHVFFRTDDGVTGSELYAFPFADTGGHLTEVYGTGCPGTGGVAPRITASSPPLLGGTFEIELEDGLPLSFAALFHALSPGALPLGNCTLNIGFPFFVTGTTPTDAAGAGAVTLVFPPTSALVGVPLYAQYLVADPAGAFNATASFSDALEVLTGPQ